MILPLLALALQTPMPSAAPLGAIGRQALPKQGCAAFLWSIPDRTLIAMARADPAQLRLSLDGRTVDVVRTAQDGDGALGFARTTSYAGGDVTATLEMTIVTDSNLTQGARISDAVLRVARPGGDMIVVPVAGLVGCA